MQKSIARGYSRSATYLCLYALHLLESIKHSNKHKSGLQIKVEKETGAQQARTEASKLIWAKVEVCLLHKMTKKLRLTKHLCTDAGGLNACAFFHRCFIEHWPAVVAPWWLAKSSRYVML